MVSVSTTDQEPNKSNYHEEDESEDESAPTGMFIPMMLAQTEEVREETCDEV